MSDIFEKITGLKLSGDTYESEQRYRLVVAGLTALAGLFFLPYSALLWIITAVKVKNYIKAYMES